MRERHPKNLAISEVSSSSSGTQDKLPTLGLVHRIYAPLLHSCEVNWIRTNTNTHAQSPSNDVLVGQSSSEARGPCVCPSIAAHACCAIAGVVCVGGVETSCPAGSSSSLAIPVIVVVAPGTPANSSVAPTGHAVRCRAKEVAILYGLRFLNWNMKNHSNYFGLFECLLNIRFY